MLASASCDSDIYGFQGSIGVLLVNCVSLTLQVRETCLSPFKVQLAILPTACLIRFPVGQVPRDTGRVSQPISERTVASQVTSCKNAP